jgi:uncharacterized membrane protein YhaH (DUF805 family)
MNYYAEAWGKYATFRGRARRRELWEFDLWNTLALCALLLFRKMSGSSVLGTALNLISWLFILAIFIPTFAVMVRRIHDVGKSGWWILIGLIPGIGGLALLIFSVVDSMTGDNKYGSNPKGIVAVTNSTASGLDK